MKFYFHTKELPVHCGVMRFLNRLMAELKKQGYSVTTDFSEQDITHMVCIVADRETINECRRRNIEIIARFSEINIHYYDRLKLTYMNADKIIFQSHSNSIDFNFEFGHREVPQTIIKNGIDYFEFPKVKNKNKRIISFGSFNKRANGSHVKKNKALKYILESLLPFFDANPEWEYHIVGPIDNFGDFAQYKNHPCIKFHVPPTIYDFFGNDYIYEVAKDCSVYIHPVMYDSCPNALIEALSMGLPIVYFHRGALAEMFDLQEQIGIGYYPENIRDGVQRAYNVFSEYNQIALEISKTRYNIKKVAKQYKRFICE